MPGQALEQGALAASVSSDDPEELAVRYVETDVVDRPQLVERMAAERMERPLLQGVVLLMRNAERLGHVRNRHGQELPVPTPADEAGDCS